MEIFTKRFSEILRQRNIEQTVFAERIDTSRHNINKYYLGKSKPPIDVLVRICTELGVTADYLLGMADE